MTLTIVTAPADEPVTTAEVKEHARVDVDDDDNLIAGLIRAARQHIEAVTDRSIIETTWDWVLPGWPAGGTFVFPRAPLSSVTSVKYFAPGEVSQSTWNHATNGILIQPTNQPGTLSLLPNAEWPSVEARPDAVTVRFVAGYGDLDDVPPQIRQAILLLVGHWYDERSAVSVGVVSREIEFTLSNLLWGVSHGRYC